MKKITKKKHHTHRPKHLTRFNLIGTEKKMKYKSDREKKNASLSLRYYKRKKKFNNITYIYSSKSLKHVKKTRNKKIIENEKKKK